MTIQLMIEGTTGEQNVKTFKTGTTLEQACDVCENYYNEDYLGYSYSILIDGIIYVTYEN